MLHFMLEKDDSPRMAADRNQTADFLGHAHIPHRDKR